MEDSFFFVSEEDATGDDRFVAEGDSVVLKVLFDEDTGRKKFGDIWKNFCIEKCEHFINFLDKFHDLKNEIGETEVAKRYYLKDDVHFNKKGNIFIFNHLKEIF